MGVCILKGPDFSYPLEPLQFETEIYCRQKDSKWVGLIGNSLLFNDEECKARFFTSYLNENRMNLRIMLVDKRANGPDRVFGGGNDNFSEEPIEDFVSDEVDGNDNDDGNRGSVRDRDRYSSASSSRSDSLSDDSSDFSDSRESDMYSDLGDYSSEEF